MGCRSSRTIPMTPVSNARRFPRRGPGRLPSVRMTGAIDRPWINHGSPMDLPRGRLAPFTPCAVGALQRAHAVTGERLAGACAPPRSGRSPGSNGPG